MKKEYRVNDKTLNNQYYVNKENLIISIKRHKILYPLNTVEIMNCKTGITMRAY